MNARPLEGRVALVAGATRGAGRGIARGLGEAGATVYCTGRSVTGNPSPYGRPETIGETAEMIAQAGGKAVALRVDHTVEEEVRSLVDTIRSDHDRLDVLVNCIGGEDPMLGGFAPFWEGELSDCVPAINNSLLSHLITAKHAAPLMIEKKKGLIVEVTDGDLPGGSGKSFLSQLVKAAVKDLSCAMAFELRAHGVAALAITPGFLRSESMLEYFGVTEKNWRQAGDEDKYFLGSETPLFVGRAVAALSGDPDVFARSGKLTSSWELAHHYGFTDADGSIPDMGAQLRAAAVELDWFREGLQRQAEFLDQMAARARDYLSDS